MDRKRVETARADEKVPQCPPVRYRHDPESHHRLVPPRVDLGHNGEPDAAAHHRANVLETVEANAQFEGLAFSGSMGGQMPLQRALGRETDEWLVQHLGKRHLVAAGERMVARADQHQAIDFERPGFKCSRISRVRSNAEVGMASGVTSEPREP